MAFDIENPLVFGLHGMGEHGPGWSKGLFDALDRAVADFQYSAIQTELKAKKKASVKDLVDFQEICYGGVFQNLLKNWAKNATDAIQRAQNLPEQQKIERGAGWLERNGDPNDGFVWTHLMDVFFWLTSSYVRAMVKNEVAAVLSAQVAARRKKDKGNRVQVSLVAHSLGTAVARDTLNDMYSGGWVTQRWSPDYVKLDSYHAIANVCELLSFDGVSVYDGYVRPTGGGQSAVTYFNDYRHRLDPFTFVRPFKPEGWSHDLYDQVGVQHIRGANVHAIEHYVQHPSVHIRMLRSWFGYSCISGDEERNAQLAFPDVPVNDPDGIVKVVEDAASFAQRDFTLSPDLVDLLKGIATFRSSIEDAEAPKKGPKKGSSKPKGGK